MINDELKQFRLIILRILDQLLNIHHRPCERMDCLTCNEIVKYGFLYELLTSYIRELRGGKTSIKKIIRSHITYGRLSVQEMENSLQLLDEKLLHYLYDDVLLELKIAKILYDNNEDEDVRVR